MIEVCDWSILEDCQTTIYSQERLHQTWPSPRNRLWTFLDDLRFSKIAFQVVQRRRPAIYRDAGYRSPIPNGVLKWLTASSINSHPTFTR